jgi:hypothetical protein
MFVRKFIQENPNSYKIMMFDFANCVNKSLGQPWRFSVTGSNELIT